MRESQPSNGFTETPEMRRTAALQAGRRCASDCGVRPVAFDYVEPASYSGFSVVHLRPNCRYRHESVGNWAIGMVCS